MEKKSKSIVIVVVGIALFLGSMIFLLPIAEFYLLALLLMFGAVIMIGISGALMKGFDSSFQLPTDECYYCQGSGKTKTGEQTETCARCGGTGLARPDDQK